MMKKLLMGAVALAAMQAAPAMAEDFTVGGTVNQACSVIAVDPIAFGTIGINGSTGLLNPVQSKSSAGTNIWCNGVSSKLAFTGNTISNVKPVSDAAHFTNSLTFMPKVSLNGTDIGTGATIGAVAASLVVTADTLNDGGKIPVAGDYTGTITVTLTPGV